MRYQYLTCCVESDGKSINAMTDQARDITFGTFARHCDWQPWARSVGYSIGAEPGPKLGTDYAVSFHKSVYRGKPCYYVRWSAIECIFCKAQS